jgi:hypothetical protein
VTLHGVATLHPKPTGACNMDLKNMSPEYIAMLDIMWNIQSPEELTEWMETLDERQMKMAASLRLLMIYEMIDMVTETPSEEDLASTRELLKNY